MKRRIAVLTSSYPQFAGDPSGHFVESEVRELVAAGETVTVIAPGDAPNVEHGNPRVIYVAGARLFTAPGALPRLRENPLRGWHAWRFVSAARRALLKRGPFDALIAHWLVPCAWPLLCCLPRGERDLEIVAHGSDVRVLLHFPRYLAARLLAQLLARGARFRAVSAALARDLRELGGAHFSGEIRVTACALDLPPLPFSAATARRKLGIFPCERLVCIMGRLIAEKRPRVALETAQYLNAQQILVIGDGPLKLALQREFSGSHIHWLGSLPRPQALAWLNASDLLICASQKEGAPTVIREARALGVPVLSEAAGDLADWARADAGIWLSRLPLESPAEVLRRLNLRAALSHMSYQTPAADPVP